MNPLYLIIAVSLLASGIGYAATPLIAIQKCLQQWHLDYRRVNGIDSSNSPTS